MNLNDIFDKKANEMEPEMTDHQKVDSSIQNDQEQDIVETSRLEAIQLELENEKIAKLRYLADYQNLLKQSQERVNEARLVGSSMLVGKLLDFVEDFNRGLEHVRMLDNIDEIKSSFDQILLKLEQILNAQDIEEIPCAVGDEYNPETMEAISAPSGESKVTIIAQKGFRFKNSGKIIRSVKVIL